MQSKGRADAGPLVGLPGLEAVEHQLEDIITVLRAEQRRTAGSGLQRSAWKNLVFAGAPGSGKSRTAAAIGPIYKELGLLSLGHLDEMSAVDFVGATRSETSVLLGSAAKHSTGCVLMINDAHAWYGLPDRGQHVLGELYKKLTEYRKEMRDDLAVILAGQAEPLRRMLYTTPPLAARFGAFVDFPGYTLVQLTAVFSTLASEAGLSLTEDAEHKAADVLAHAQAGHAPGNARLAVRLLDQAKTAQARRLAGSPGAQHPDMLRTVIEADIPQYLGRDAPPSSEDRSGQYL
jgi:hypothetical protein